MKRALAAMQPKNPERVAPSDSYVQSFARGLAVIRSFGHDAKTQTLTQVAERTGLDRAGASGGCACARVTIARTATTRKLRTGRRE